VVKDKGRKGAQLQDGGLDKGKIIKRSHSNSHLLELPGTTRFFYIGSPLGKENEEWIIDEFRLA
jgi:hypothetical protein